MKKRCKLLCSLLAVLLICTACRQAKPDAGALKRSFQDSTGHTVEVNATLQCVAVLFSSLADIWVSAGGTVSVTVGETVERGIVATDGVTLVDSGAGKTIDTEALIAAQPDLVIVSADIPAQTEAAALLREAHIPVAELRVESFTDYLKALEICVYLCGDPIAYQAHGVDQKTRIDAVLSQKPFHGQKILFIRAGSTARSVKAKGSADHFAASMLTELGAINIADGAPLLLDGLSMEVILAEDPDYIFFTAMGDEEASKSYITQMLTGETWQSLSAVQNGKWSYLPKELFHYKPCDRWAEAYDYLAALAHQ